MIDSPAVETLPAAPAPPPPPPAGGYHERQARARDVFEIAQDLSGLPVWHALATALRALAVDLSPGSQFTRAAISAAGCDAKPLRESIMRGLVIPVSEAAPEWSVIPMPAEECHAALVERLGHDPAAISRALDGNDLIVARSKDRDALVALFVESLSVNASLGQLAPHVAAPGQIETVGSQLVRHAFERRLGAGVEPDSNLLDLAENARLALTIRADAFAKADPRKLDAGGIVRVLALALSGESVIASTARHFIATLLVAKTQAQE